MKYPEYERAFSAARLNKYLTACDGNTAKALILYRHNVKLCQKFYGMLNIFEVILRNAINEHYKAYFNDSDWIRNQLAPGGMLSQHPQKSVVDKTIADLTAAGRYTNDRVVSSVTFGFWTYLFTKKPFRLGGQSFWRASTDYKTPGASSALAFERGTTGTAYCKGTNSSGYNKTPVTNDNIYLRSTSLALLR